LSLPQSYPVSWPPPLPDSPSEYYPRDPIIVAGLYGAIGVYIGESLPQLSNARIGDPGTGLRIRSLQSGAVFTLIGAIMIWYGLAAIRLAETRSPASSGGTSGPRWCSSGRLSVLS
jgi:hypothetical protein